MKEKETVIIDEVKILEEYKEENNFNSTMEPHSWKELLEKKHLGLLLKAMCQRFECTKREKSNNYVVSILCGNGVGGLQLSISGEIIYVLNGLQRISAVEAYVNDEFPLDLSKTTLKFESEKGKTLYKVFHNKKFSELSKKSQEYFLNQKVWAETFYNMSFQNESDVYVSTNKNATNLSKMECAKAKATPLVWNKIEKLVDDPVFSNIPKSNSEKRMIRHKNIVELWCIQLGYIKNDDFTKNINELFLGLNDLEEEELNRVASIFLKEMKMYSNSTLYAAAKNKKSFAALKNEKYCFFDERALFYIFHRECLIGDSFDQKLCDKVKEKALTLFTTDKKSFRDRQNEYQKLSSNGTDKVSSVKRAAALILGEV